MGLLSWRRSARGSDGAPKAPEAPPSAAPSGGGGPPASGDRAVIRADDLMRVPDWATLPPMAPILPEMPFVVARRFDDSLTSWQPPEQFLRPLGHSVSPTAPAGVVDGIMVLTPASEAEPATGPEGESEADVSPPVTGTGAPAAGEQPLILATPPVTPSGAAGERRVMSSAKPPRAVGSAGVRPRRLAARGTGAPRGRPAPAIAGWPAGAAGICRRHPGVRRHRRVAAGDRSVPTRRRHRDRRSSGRTGSTGSGRERTGIRVLRGTAGVPGPSTGRRARRGRSGRLGAARVGLPASRPFPPAAGAAEPADPRRHAA